VGSDVIVAVDVKVRVNVIVKDKVEDVRSEPVLLERHLFAPFRSRAPRPVRGRATRAGRS